MRCLVDNLDFFISPITGKLYGTSQLPSLPHNNIWIGDENNVAQPNLQIGMINMPNLSYGYLWVGDSDNRPSETRELNINVLPYLGPGNIWRGITDPFDPIYGYPEVSGSLTALEDSFDAFVLATAANFANVYSAIAAAVLTLEGQIDALTFEVSQCVKLDGSKPMTGELILSGPAVDPLGAVTLAQLQAAIGGGSYKVACYAASTGPYLTTYDNGASGVGATLTNADTLATFTTDGTTPPVNSRILIKDQTHPDVNGCYVLTDTGSPSRVWILTRATDYDTPADIQPGDIFTVINGTVNFATGWIQTDVVNTIGTDNIQFIQFTYNSSTFLKVANNLSDLNNTATARVNLGLTNVAIQHVTQHSVLLGGASDAITSIAVPTTANYVLLSGASADPSWSTATYPVTTTAYQLLYSSANNTITGLSTSNNGILITNGSGIPSISTNPSGITSLGVGNISLTANTISSTNTNGNIILMPNGSGQVQTTGYLILNADATDPLGAVTLNQLNSVVSGINFKFGCYAATTGSNLNALYFNGTAGVGATLTNLGSLAAFAIDGTTPSVGARILVKDQTITYQNGIYSITILGSGAVAWVLTRTSDFDSSTTIEPGNVVPVEFGTKNALSSWLQSATVTTVGTDPIIFFAFTYGPSSFLQVLNNLADVNDVSMSRFNLGLTNVAIQNVTNHSVLLGGTSNSITSIAVPSTANQVLLSGASADPAWSTATYPASTTINQLLYSSSANVIAGLATANNGVLITSSGGVPSISSTIPNATQLNITALGTIATGVWQGSIVALAYGGTAANLTASNGGIVYSTASAMAILAGTATANQVLLSGSSTTPAWSTATYPATTTINQLLYSSSANVVAGLATGNNGVLITSSGGVPSISSTIPNATQLNITALGTIATGVWQGTLVALAYGGSNANLTASNGGIVYSTASAMAILVGTATANQMLLSGSSTTPAWSTVTHPATTTINQILYSSAANVLSGLATANNGVLITNGSGVPAISSTPSGLTSIGVGNLSLSGNTLSSTNTNGNISIIPNGSGQVLLNADATSALGALTYEQLLYINYKGSCYASSTAALTATYSNGTAGVGATLTNSGTLAAFSIDGVNPAVGARILIKNQSSTFQNGIYSVTTVGSGAVAWVLTRTTDYNVVAYINPGDLVLVINGTANGMTSWMQTTTMVTIGTTAVTFSAFTTNIAGESVTQHSVLVGGAANTITSIAVPSTANQMLLSGASADPAWSTVTHPATTTINQILYSSAANVLSGLATANNGVLITSSGGVPSISSTLPAAVQGNITSVGTIATGVWQGSNVDLADGGTNASLTASNGGIVYSTASAFAILAGTSNARKILLSGANTTPQWSTAVFPSGTIPINNLLYASTLNGITPLATAISGTLVTDGFGVPSIQSTLAGPVQLNITQVGTVTSGTWNAGIVALAYGGTAANLTASNGGIVYSTASAMAILAGTATANQMLLSGSSTIPAWSTVTHPATTTINQILYSSAANVLSGLATGNNGVLITSSGGVPSISSTIPNATQLNITALGTIATGVWQGTAIGTAYGGSSGLSNGYIPYYSSGLANSIMYQGAGPVATGIAIGGTDLRGVLTVQQSSTTTWSANTDPTDNGRYFVMENTSTTNNASEFSNITLQINPTGSIGGGRCLADIRLVRTTANSTNSTFLFSNFNNGSTYQDVFSLGNSSSYMLSNLYIGGQTAPTAVLQLAAGSSSTASFIIGSSSSLLTSPVSGAIEYDNTSLYYTTSAPARRKITSFEPTGPLLIGQSSITSSAGILQVTGGITFPASPTPVSNSNTISEYKWGSYTPAFVNGTFTYVTQQGGYVQIGAFVYAYAKIVWSGNTGATGQIIAVTLPLSTSGNTNGGMLIANTNINITAANSASMAFQANSGSTSMTLYYMASGTTTAVLNQNLSSSGTLHAIFMYSSGYTI